MLLPKCVFNYNIIDKSNGSVHAGITVFMIAIQNNWEKKNYNSSLWNQLLTTIFKILIICRFDVLLKNY